MIIDIFGIPGSGKSYLAYELIKMKSNSTKNLTLIERTTFHGKVLKKLGMFMIKKVFNKKLYKDKNYNFLIQKYNQKGKYNTNRNIQEYIYRMLYIQLQYNFYNKFSKKDFIVEEGVYHAIITMAVDFEIESKDVKLLTKYIYNKNKKNKLTVIYHKATVLTAERSIKKRNRKSAPIDFLVGKELLFFLKEYEKYCELVSNLVNPEIHYRKG